MTQKAIAEEVSLPRSTVANHLVGSVQIKGYNMTIDLDTSAPEGRGTAKRYTIARLERDGHVDLAGQVAQGSVSARQARLQVGYEAPSVTVSWRLDADPEAIANQIWKFP